MPTKTYDDASGQFLVEFRLPAEAGAAHAWLAGDFNGWATDAAPLELQDDGSLSVEVPLEPGQSYRFRYYLGDGQWENDWAADEYVGNEHGGSDSVVHVPEAGGPPPVVADGVEGPEVSVEPEIDDREPAKAAKKKAGAAKKAAKKKAPAKKAEPAKKAAKKKAAGVKKAAKKAPGS